MTRELIVQRLKMGESLARMNYFDHSSQVLGLSTVEGRTTCLGTLLNLPDSAQEEIIRKLSDDGIQLE